MKMRNIAAFGFLFSGLVIAGDAAALPVDNPGTFTTWQISLGAPFIDFPNGYSVTMDQQWTMSFSIPNGTTGTITNGTFTYPTLPVNGYPGLTAQLVPDTCQAVGGSVDAGHGSYKIVMEGKLVFQLGGDMCITPTFKYEMDRTGTNPPGAHTITDLNAEGKAQVDVVQKSPTCSGTSASAINTALSLGPSNSTTFWFYKAGVTTIKGSY